MRDFTFKTYQKLIEQILKSGFEFQTMEEFILAPKNKVVVFRHDSDIWPKNDLKMAILENQLNVKSTYYFRIPETFNEAIIRKLAVMSHEIGYHYEDLVRSKGNTEKAIKNFKINLQLLRSYFPVMVDLFQKLKVSTFGRK
jgi:predicted lipase